MKKKIAVIAKDRKDEAIRMAVGLSLMDDSVDVFVLDGKLEDSEKNRLNLETMELTDMKIYTNTGDNEGMEQFSTEDIAQRLLGYDLVIPY
ncbi:MAG: hypothetical protein C4538_02345 [Nitrospiraceae bacterium]|nr:MAG: hypothetical protein C4538_02345 [Nitrospiraceae bacterium]